MWRFNLQKPESDRESVQEKIFLVTLKHPTVHPEAVADLMKEVGNNFRSAQSYYEPIIG